MDWNQFFSKMKLTIFLCRIVSSFSLAFGKFMLLSQQISPHVYLVCAYDRNLKARIFKNARWYAKNLTWETLSYFSNLY